MKAEAVAKVETDVGGDEKLIFKFVWPYISAIKCLNIQLLYTASFPCRPLPCFQCYTSVKKDQGDWGQGYDCAASY